MDFKRSLDDSENESAKRAYLRVKYEPNISKSQEGQVNEPDNQIDNMMYACKNGCVEIVEGLLKHGFDVNSRNNTTNSALHYAAESGQAEIVKKLLENGALPDLVNKDYFTPLHFASINGNIQVIKELLKYKINVNFETVEGENALAFAARNGHLNIVKELLKAGAYAYNEIEENVCQFPVLDKLHYPNELSENHIEIIIEVLKSHPHPIHEAISILEIPEINTIIQRLSESGISLDLQDRYGDTALHRAVFDYEIDVKASKHQFQVLVELLKHGVNTEIKNSYNETPLQVAFEFNKPAFVRELLRYGANPNHKMPNSLEKSLLHIACCESNISMVKVLLEHGVNVNEIDKEKVTPLHSTCLNMGENGNQIIKVLLWYGADVNFKDHMNITPMHHAAWNREIQDDLFKELLKQCTDPNVKGFEDGQTPLDNAIIGGHKSKVKYLLEHGADPYTRDYNENTSFETALSCRQIGTFKLIIYKT